VQQGKAQNGFATVAIRAEDQNSINQISEDAKSAGYHVISTELICELFDNPDYPQADIIIYNVDKWDDRRCEALSNFDHDVKVTGQHLIITSKLEFLENIFGCFNRSNPKILIATHRFEMALALARLRPAADVARVRNFADDDRLMLLRLTEQIENIAARLDGNIGTRALTDRTSEASAFRFESASAEYTEPYDPGSERLVRATRPPLPDPRLVRQIIRQRQLRARFFEGDLFADPAWDMLLDLTAARAEHTRVSVTSLCIASGVPPTTALRWIGQMTEAGLLERVEDETDRRRAFVTLTEKASEAMARYFADLGREASRFV